MAFTDDPRHPSSISSEGLYRLDNANITFFKQLTGIGDDELLKINLLSVQASRRGLRGVSIPLHTALFVGKPRISRLFAYPDPLKLGRVREGAILLETGCCLGTDVRKAIADVFPLKNVVTTIPPVLV
ncbi:hypothetical protein EI94DRAFT_976094 [Lactarius quietus]|nr:hypothetical protein EI94DRAFT_976094 [Lactarius quietus]